MSPTPPIALVNIRSLPSNILIRRGHVLEKLPPEHELQIRARALQDTISGLNSRFIILISLIEVMNVQNQ